MGVCLSKGQRHHHHGHMLTNDEDSGFCTPEGVSLQYESRNPSGRYSFAHLETPRISADVGDLGALGSLFYKRGSRSRDNNTTTTVASNYISPLDMFLGGVRVRNRVHHVNQICAGDYSFASYLASPLLKGFDVHAMEAVAKSYAESAAKAAARDAFVFLEENDMSVVSTSSGGFQDAEGCNVSTSSAAAGDDCGDVDDDLAKSGESDEWEDPRKVENCWVVHNQNEEAETNNFHKPCSRSGEEAETNNFNKPCSRSGEEAETNNFNKPASRSGEDEAETDRFNESSSRFREEEAETNKFSKPSSHFRESNERGTNERWVSVLNAVQARAKARRRQRRKSCLGKAHGGGPDRVQRSGSGRKQKTVRFRLAGVEEGFTDDDVRSGKESECDQAPLQDKDEAVAILCNNNNSAVQEVKAAACATSTALQQHSEAGDDRVQCVERSGNDNGSGGDVAMAEEECDNYYIWQEEEEEDDNGGEEEDGRYGKEKIIEAEFLGFTFTASGRFNGGVIREPRPGGAVTPLMGPRAVPPANVRHVHHPSLDSFSSSEYFLPETSFGSSQQLEEEVLLEDFSLPPGIDEDEDEAMSSGNHNVPRSPDDEEEDEEGADFRGIDGGKDSRQFCSADCGECEADAAFPPRTSGADGCHTLQQEMPSSSFMKDISVSNDKASAPPAIPVGCVVVESRMPDGSRLTPQILELSEVQLPERGEDNYGFFHARVLCHGEEPSGSDPNLDVEGGFSFPVLLQPSSSMSSPENSSGRGPEERAGGLWRAPPLGDPDTPIKNRSIRPHLPPPQPLPPPMSAMPLRQIPEINTSPQKSTVSDDSTTTTTSCDPSCSFSFETEQPVFTKKTHKIVLPTLTPRSMSPSPVFSPSKVTTSSLRSTVAAAAAATAPFLSTIQVASVPHPPRARRTLNRKLKFYSLERASYAAAGAKRSNSSKSPPSFGRQSRERRRDTDGESDSDLFEIETMSGTNAMGSSRTPPSTPTKSPRKWTAPAPASIDLEKLSDSIARVSRSRSKRSTNNATGKPLPTPQSRDPKARCLPVERRKDSSSIFQGRSGGATMKSIPNSSLKGRALLKLGLLMRSPKHQHVRSDFRKDSTVFRSSETSVSEYLENRPPSPPGVRYHHPHGQCGQCFIEEERAAAVNHNYAFEWYCSSTAQRVAPLHHEKRLQQQQGFSSHKSFSNEDRTFAVKN